MRLNYFLKQWKHTTIVTIAKPEEDSSKPENHRPSSLLAAFSKILEGIILTRLN